MKKYNVFNEDKVACFDSESNRFITRFMDHDQYKKWLSVYKSIGDKPEYYGTLLLSTCLRRMRKAHKPTEYKRQIKQLGLRTQGQRGAGKKPSKRGIVLQISIRAEKKHLAPKIKEYAKKICSDKE
jgi:hypothetical protein